MPTTATPPRSATVAALLLALTATAAAIVETGLQVRADRSRGEDAVSLSADRLEALRFYLPARGRVGYVTYVPPDELRRNDRTGEVDVAAQRAFYLIQYNVAPLALVNSTDPEWLVGYFPDGAPPETGRLEPFRIVRDFGEGFILFRRRDR
jgi:hypothetical protein